MLLVRWVGTEVRVFAYLQNGILVAAFFGLGLGCRNSRSPVRVWPAMLALGLLAFVIRDPLGVGVGEAVTRGLVALEDRAIWAANCVGPECSAGAYRAVVVAYSVIATLALLCAVAIVFQPVGQRLGRWMDAYPRPIAAYTANLLGSIAGVALFDAATLALTPPWVWLLAAGVGLAAFALHADDGTPLRVAAVLIALALPLVGLGSPRYPSVWSPYQKLTLLPFQGTPSTAGRALHCGEEIQVNNTSYQLMLNLDPTHMAAQPEVYPPGEIGVSHYLLPYKVLGPRERVLIVGAGAGNDAAAALRSGASQVRAVEIDPVIVEWGRARHPNKPYASERVTATIDDARAFFRRHEGRYDLVWFGLLDSHTNPSAYTNVRLDHFVYTRESFADVKRLLAPGGLIVLFFEAQTSWISDRLAGLLRDTFGTLPMAFEVRTSTHCLGYGGLLLLAGSEEALAGPRELAKGDDQIRGALLPVQEWSLKTPATTDDWPYLYLQAPGIPTYHVLMAFCCLALGLLLRRRLFAGGEALDLPMLLLGAGFMLLEVSGVSRAALLYGTTWTVNAYVVGAILAMSLLANAVAARVAYRPGDWPFAGLVAALCALALMPPGWLAALPGGLRVVLGGAFLTLPVFFSGLVFVRLWAAGLRRDLALGSNLLGALLGGVASMLSMAIGFRGLMFLTLAAYLAAFAALRRRAQP